MVRVPSGSYAGRVTHAQAVYYALIPKQKRSMKQMKRITIAYWIITVLFGGFMLFSAIPDVMNSPDAIDFIKKLGYPLYFVPFIGVAKILGAAAILVPGLPRVKEWAYAGLIFDLVGAMYSVGCVYGAAAALPMLLLIAFGIASYLLYHRKVKMGKAPLETKA
jgi:hypothetical protein